MFLRDLVMVSCVIKDFSSSMKYSTWKRAPYFCFMERICSVREDKLVDDGEAAVSNDDDGVPLVVVGVSTGFELPHSHDVQDDVLPLPLAEVSCRPRASTA